MNKKYIIIIIITVLITAGLLESRHLFEKSNTLPESTNSFEECSAKYPVMESYPRQCNTPDGKHFVEEIDQLVESPYAGQETRWIKSLPQEDIRSLQKGSGVAFGGMAKLAELNGYPGPRHVLEMTEQIDLTDEQQNQIEAMFSQMQSEATPLGEQIIQLEKEMDDMFANKTITPEVLESKLNDSAELYGQLRFVHLKYHFQTLEVLTPEQVEQYNELRGYASDTDPCESIPEGHDSEMWKLHNGC